MIAELDELSSRKVVLFGGKGGVGKTTIASAAALHYSDARRTLLFTTDPASNLGDLGLSIPLESLDAHALYQRFLGTHLDAFLEIADRGTYLDREELRRFFELSLPGVDELMAWMRIGELAESDEYEMVVVDTAPTGHTLRMLSSGDHFRQLAVALDAMEEKHRALVRQFTRRDVRDAMDAFIEEFDARAQRWRDAILRGAFIPVTLPEPLVIEQTQRLIAELEIDVPFVVLNRSRGDERPPFARVMYAPRSCVPLDSEERIRAWTSGVRQPQLPLSLSAKPTPKQRLPPHARLTFFAGKGGVGKTSCATSLALQLARDTRCVLLSVDPAHSLRDVFASQPRPENLRVETIDTKAKWAQFRETIGREIEDAVDALTPRGITIEHDVEAVRRLVEIAPPGADELFAITRLADILGEEAPVIVDTAPTGHFLRLLDLPSEAGEWVRELMRLLLRYKELIPPASLGEELVRASRALKELDEALRSETTSVIVVTRPERIVIAETKRLMDELRRRGIAIGGVIANYVTPENDDPCDQSMRGFELAALEEIDDSILIERRSLPPTTLAELASLVPR